MAALTGTGWEAEVLRLKAEGMESKDIAGAVGKHAATVRKVIARAAASTNGNGPHIEGQTTVDDFTVPPEDDPQYEPPPREMDGGETIHVDEIVVSGTTQLGLFDAGGRTPDSASVRLAGGKVGLIHGEAFRKGDVIRFTGTAVVSAVKQQDKRDGKTGQVVGCEQQHTALITDLTVG